MNLIALIAGLAIQAPAPAPSSPGLAVLSECDASSDVVAKAPRDAALDVHYSIAGAPTCYFVSVSVQGRTVQGFVLDRQAPAVVAFEKSRVETEQTAFKAPLPLPPSAEPQPQPEPAKAPQPVAVKASESKKPMSKTNPKVSM